MPYSIDRYSSNLFDAPTGFPLNIADNAIDSTSTSIRILGRGITNYGEIVAETLIHMTEHFAGVVSPSNPITGQLWWEQDPTNPAAPQKLQLWNGTIWKSISGATGGVAPPGGPALGDLWYDTVNNSLIVYDGTVWVALYGDNNLPSNPGPVAPPAAIEGYLWYNTTTDILQVYDGTNWLPLVTQNTYSDPTTTTFLSYDTINGIEVVIMEVDGQILHIWTPTPILVGSLWDGVTPAGKPNLQALYPAGLNVGNNLSNVPGNGISSNGSVFYGAWTLAPGATVEANYADIAERYAADAIYEPGTLVSLGGSHEITATTNSGEVAVFGVVSTAPAFKLNKGAGDDKSHPYIASSGRIPLKVIGTIQKGDRLMSSKLEGVAQAYDKTLFDDPFDAVMAIFGRALETKTTTGQGIIEASVGAK